MREIKFRFWDKKQSKVYSWEHVLSNNVLQPFMDMDSVIPMQYTGLKDKNGKEIYEGDIVNWHYPASWWNDGAGVEQQTVKWDGHICGFDPFASADVEGDYPQGDFEVIGNIYENKELLK